MPVTHAYFYVFESVFESISKSKLVAGETDPFDAAPKAERKTVFPRGSLARRKRPLKLGSMRRR